MAMFVAESKSVAQGGAQAAQRPMAFTPNRLALFWDSAIGKKIVMAVTGVVLVAFVIAHMLGNLKIFEGPDRDQRLLAIFAHRRRARTELR